MQETNKYLSSVTSWRMTRLSMVLWFVLIEIYLVTLSINFFFKEPKLYYFRFWDMLHNCGMWNGLFSIQQKGTYAKKITWLFLLLNFVWAPYPRRSSLMSSNLKSPYRVYFALRSSSRQKGNMFFIYFMLF